MAASPITGSHFVGSLNTDSAEEAFRTASELTPHATRIPDGETGRRWHWIAFQAEDVADNTPGLTKLGDEPFLMGGFDVRPIGLDGTVELEDIQIGSLGYAEAAIESYAVFAKLKTEGVVREHVRFQVSLPSSIATPVAFFAPELKLALEPAYRAALKREIAQIVDAIPHDQLAIQFDCAVEFGIIEGIYPFPDFDGVKDSVALLSDLVAAVPAEVQVGFHLCYGDVAEAHFFEPADATNLVRFANTLVAEVQRPVAWVHLPAPIQWDTAEPYQPLAALSLPESTELYLGIVHREDGEEGIRTRAGLAGEVVERFGISTECGFGRSPREAIHDLFTLHETR